MAIQNFNSSMAATAIINCRLGIGSVVVLKCCCARSLGRPFWSNINPLPSRFCVFFATCIGHPNCSRQYPSTAECAGAIIVTGSPVILSAVILRGTDSGVYIRAPKTLPCQVSSTQMICLHFRDTLAWLLVFVSSRFLHLRN